MLWAALQCREEASVLQAPCLGVPTRQVRDPREDPQAPLPPSLQDGDRGNKGGPCVLVPTSASAETHPWS